MVSGRGYLGLLSPYAIIKTGREYRWDLVVSNVLK
jgi:hypothetical protein